MLLVESDKDQGVKANRVRGMPSSHAGRVPLQGVQNFDRPKNEEPRTAGLCQCAAAGRTKKKPAERRVSACSNVRKGQARTRRRSEKPKPANASPSSDSVAGSGTLV